MPLLRLEGDTPDVGCLCGCHVKVRNAGVLPAFLPGCESPRVIAVCDARPDPDGNFLFEPSRGGARIDRIPASDLAAQECYLQASRFGEVNTYYHLDRIAAYIDGLLQQLGAASLPRVTAVVNAHSAVVERNGITDGVRYEEGWRPFQGGHYRLPGPRSSILEAEPVSPDGEIHLGPGWQLLKHGALTIAVGGSYRHNASHNGAILYHEYGHHVSRHTADFMGNARRSPHLQENRKTPLDEGICDYWAAAMLDSPNIWAWHRRQDGRSAQCRHLASARTLESFDPYADADPHLNGTIWAAALWDLRTAVALPRAADLLVVKMLLLWRTFTSDMNDGAPEAFIRGRESFEAALSLLLHADAALFDSTHRDLILHVFSRRGITPGRLLSHQQLLASEA